MSHDTPIRRGRPRNTAKDESILHAAGDLFMGRGYEAVSLDAVAQAAGVSKATIYARYADKDALFSAVLRNECESVVSTDSFLPSPDQSPRDTLILLAERFLELVTGEKAIQMNRVIVAEADRAPRVAELFYETAVLSLKSRVAGWIETENELGRLQVKDPHGAAWRYLGAVKAEAHLRATFGLEPIEPLRLRSHIESAADEFMRAHGPAVD
jgi:TetR/AcrR family transcriptional repressor of mexJK operon